MANRVVFRLVLIKEIAIVRILIYLRLQFVWGIVGKHIHGRCLASEKVGNDLWIEGEVWTELPALHVVENGVAELAGHDALL